MSRKINRKQLALLMEKCKDIPVDVDPAWAKVGREFGESVWKELQPHLAVSGTSFAG